MVVISVTFYLAVYLPEQNELRARMTTNTSKARLDKDGALAALLYKSQDYRSWTSGDYRRQVSNFAVKMMDFASKVMGFSLRHGLLATESWRREEAGEV